MKVDFQAQYALPPGPCDREIDDLLAARNEYAPLIDWAARLQILAQAIVSPSRIYAQSSDRQNRPAGLHRVIREGHLDRYFQHQVGAWLRPLGLLCPDPALDTLPPGSFAIQFAFRLLRPYLSRDDVDFYVLENPVRKDRVFQVPVMGTTGWKGALRATMRRQRGYASRKEEQDDAQIQSLFGAAGAGDQEGDESDSTFRAGRLFFFPTFFHQIHLEVLNPHDRDTGAGTAPIYLEAVPAGAVGEFTLLYVPLDLVGEDPGTMVYPQVVADLEAVAVAVRDLFTVYGFGARTSSGYGVAAPQFVASQSEAPDDAKPDGWIKMRGVQVRCSGFQALPRAAQVLGARLVSDA